MTRGKQRSPKTLVTDAREAIETCAGMNVRLAARRISRFMDGRLRKAGLNLARFGLMAHIAAARDDTIGALAGRSGLDQSTLSRNLRNLEKDGLIEIAIVEKDLRRRAVWLTEKGARRLEAAMPLWRDAQAILAGMVDPGIVRNLAAATRSLGGTARGS